jgi:gamma-glutamylcyclotransferase (GGCT)/AIG2-like uncharacterized protein YtfP
VLLAAYGTLMRGQANFLAPRARSSMAYAGDCLIPGRLVRVISQHDGQAFVHPALVRGPGQVRGELFEVDETALPALDAYEDFREGDLAGSMYLRELTPVLRTEPPKTVDAWVYVWNRATEGLAPIEGGDWRRA